MSARDEVDPERGLGTVSSELDGAAPEVEGGHRVEWGRPAPPGRRRGVWAVAAVAAVVVAVVATVLVAGGAPARPAPDRDAPDQVAQRYRALGATLLSGAVRCAAVRPEPGESERLDCGFGAYSMILTSYDTADRLLAARAAARALPPSSVRSAVAVQPDGAFVLDETRDTTSTVFWDSLTPRPMSATVTTTRLAPPALVAFYDARGSTVLRRPELPGPQFDSGVLWSAVGAHFADEPGAQCGHAPNGVTPADLKEEVHCTFADGLTGIFDLPVSTERFTFARAALGSDTDAVPGTHSFTTWTGIIDQSGTVSTGGLAQYVRRTDGWAYLYFDQPGAQSYGYLRSTTLTQAQLLDFWRTAFAR